MTAIVADEQQAATAIPEVDDNLRRAIAELILDGVADDAVARMLSEATSIPADALAGEVAIARKNRYLVGAERLQRRLETWSGVLQNRARSYTGASNALACPGGNAVHPEAIHSDQDGKT